MRRTWLWDEFLVASFSGRNRKDTFENIQKNFNYPIIRQCLIEKFTSWDSKKIMAIKFKEVPLKRIVKGYSQ